MHSTSLIMTIMQGGSGQELHIKMAQSGSVQGTSAGDVINIDQEEEQVAFEKSWRDYACRLVDSYCTFIAEPETELQLVQLLKALEVSKNVRGMKGSDIVVALFTCGLSSESITDPHVRGAPFKKDHAC